MLRLVCTAGTAIAVKVLNDQGLTGPSSALSFSIFPRIPGSGQAGAAVPSLRIPGSALPLVLGSQHFLEHAYTGSALPPHAPARTMVRGRAGRKA